MDGNEGKSHNPEKWREFDFPARCVLGEAEKVLLRKWAARSPHGGCCPYVLCFPSRDEPPCGFKVAVECAKRCEEFYDQYIKEQ